MSGPPVQQVEAYRGVAKEALVNERDFDDDDRYGETDNPLAVPALQTQLDEQKAEGRLLRAQLSGLQQQLRDATLAPKGKRRLPPAHAADDFIAEARIAAGGSFITCTSPPSVPKDAYDRSCYMYGACSDE
jgi:hypothetical protein